MSGRVTRSRLVGKCSCKVGDHIIGRSFCKHCKLACNCVNPTNVLARYRCTQSDKVKRKKIKATQQMPSRWSKRHRVTSIGTLASKVLKCNDDSMHILENGTNKDSNKSLEVPSQLSHSIKSISQT